MTEPTSSPTEAQEYLLQSTARRRRQFLKVALIMLALAMLFPLALFRMYGCNTHHANRRSILWIGRRDLIPPDATDITLQRDVLDHRATYKIAEKDLNTFLNERFARDGETIDSFSERSPAESKEIGKAIGSLGWVVTKDTVVYSFFQSNGSVSTFYHDPNTGQTYQSSAYW